ncbi:MAG: hypothetical protein RMM31_11265, partial [Anaerolineae bacterium]|nr:hypothetical protein [Anaerolineae bacterium]
RAHRQVEARGGLPSPPGERDGRQLSFLSTHEGATPALICKYGGSRAQMVCCAPRHPRTHPRLLLKARRNNAVARSALGKAALRWEARCL